MNDITVEPISPKRDTLPFIKFAWQIYKNFPQWVPPLIMDRKKLMDKDKNPFYKHADAEFFLARRHGAIVGRIGAIINHNHNKEHNENIGFFGFFESIDDQQVADALFDSARAWLKARGVTAVRGPASPSVNDEYGLLVDGFDKPPVVLMPYNPAYYASLIEKAGLAKIKDLYAYLVTEKNVFSEKFVRVAELVRQREGLTLRSLNMKDFKNEIQRIKDLYNRAWQYNWGAVPMTSEEFDALAKDLKPVVVPELVLIAEYQGEPVGFSLSLPDLNVAFKYNKRGRLLPGLLRLILHKKEIKLVRIIVLGVVPERAKTGAGTLLLYETGKRGIEMGYPFGEAGWVLEDNVMMNRAAEFMNGVRYKTYRIYEQSL
jgi:hypothetical protein